MSVFMRFKPVARLLETLLRTKAAAQDTGEAPNVLPIPASWIESIISLFPTTAARGNPPAIPFARVAKSGVTPTVLAQNISPVLPYLV